MNEYYDPYTTINNEIQEYTEVELNGVLMQVRMDGGNKATIVRLLRCNLDCYLDNAYAPGGQIVFKPELLS